VKRLQSEFSTAKKKTQDISANLQINGQTGEGTLFWSRDSCGEAG